MSHQGLKPKLYKKLPQLNNLQIKKRASNLNRQFTKGEIQKIKDIRGKFNFIFKGRSRSVTHALIPLKKINTKHTHPKNYYGCGEKATLLYCWWACKLIQPFLKMIWIYLKKLKSDIPYCHTIHASI